MPQPSRPLCVAAASAALIDPDKTVRPCCRYFPPEGTHIDGSCAVGRLDANTTIADVRNSKDWKQVAALLAAGKTPIGCAQCMQRERDTGHAGRKDYDDADWEKGLTFLEVNTSNICTLQCRHCDGHYSHRWARVQGMPTHRGDPDALLRSLRELDLSHLNAVAFKGGEPLLNPDLPATLKHLDAIGRLSEVTVRITTNGSVAPEELLPLLSKAKRCDIGISVDGVGELQTYIRHGRSSADNIARFVESYRSLPRVSFGAIVSVMAYNVPVLPQIEAWWTSIAGYDPKRKWQRRWQRWTRKAEFHPLTFFHFVTAPEHLAVHCLQDATRAKLAARYEQLDPRAYGQVVQMLKMPFAGARMHDRWIVETLRNDRLLGRSYREDLAELQHEFVLLDPVATFADLQRRRDVGEFDTAQHALLCADLAALPKGAQQPAQAIRP